MKTYQDLLTAYEGEKTPPDEHSDGERNYFDYQYSQHNYTTPGAECQAVFNEFIPIENSEPLPMFPLQAVNKICPVVGELIFAAAESIQTSYDLDGVGTLGALSVACRGRYPVVLPNGHHERPCFYFFPIAPPSERKSGVIDTLFRPLVDYEIEYNREHGGEVAQSQSELTLLKGRITNAQTAAIKAKTSDDRLLAEHELQELNSELAEFETVEPLRLFGADVTPEKLACMQKSQDGVFALVCAEGAAILENIGRYTDKGGMEIYLHGYSGDRVCVDRKSSESIVIDNPTLNIMAPCQPSVITDMFSDKEKAGRGLLSRMLFVKCYSRVGNRKFTSKPIDERIYTNYSNLVHNMLSASSKGDLRFDDNALVVCESFFDEIEAKLNAEDGELSFMGDWGGKLHGQMVRLAGLLHCIAAFEQGRNPVESFINADEAHAAVILARYFLEHAKAVYTEEREPQAISNARYLWGKIKSAKSITKRDLTRKTQGKRDFYLDESLTELVNRGYIRVEVIQTGGRPIEQIIINPELKQ
ncbi:MAG: DUF3987 domain-containing protein [Ruminococcus sp.]|jgi:hypothetical protein|nr:DUF3987 domain-containing protein [Ruminococcus sp.]